MFAKHVNYSKTKGPGDFSPPCEDCPEYNVDDDQLFEHLIGNPSKPEEYDICDVSTHIWDNDDLAPVMKKILGLVGNNDDNNTKVQAEIGAFFVELARDYLNVKGQDVDLCAKIAQARADEINEP